MPGMTIGEVAKRAGLAPSAIRYYEKSGLIPAPHRRSKQRRYDPEILGRIAFIQLARDAGFTIRETRTLISGFAPNTKPSARWRTLAEKKLAEIDAQMARARKMQALLKEGFRCGCPALEDCERALARSSIRGRCGRSDLLVAAC
jgi:MerR family redox-sensitive transcriptional activator SoxR